MSVHWLKTESRHHEINFTGTGFLFVRCFTSDGGRYPYEIGLHQHDWHEFVWNHTPEPADNGRHVYTLDGEAREYGHQSLLYVPPFHPHKFEVGRPLKIWVIGVDQAQTCKVFAHSPLLRPLEQLFESWVGLPAVMRPASQPAGLAAALDQLVAACPATGSLESLEAVHFLVSLDRLLGAWKTQAAPGSRPVSGSERVARLAMEYLEKHFAEPVGVDECAACIGVARSTLSHNFRAFTGQSIPQWLNDIRLRHARALLVETSLDIIEIALECGFNDAAWFSRQFRSAMGMPPSAWRNRRVLMHDSASPLHDSGGHS